LDSTNILVDFSVFGEDFDIKTISEKLEMEPSECYQKGERIRETHLFRKETCWSISTGYEESLDVNDQLEKIMKLIKPKREILIHLMQQLNLECKFSIVINIENSQTPAVYLEREVIEFANEMKAEFDFDMYIYS